MPTPITSGSIAARRRTVNGCCSEKARPLMRRPSSLTFLIAILLVAASGGRALADVIDGDWCFPDGRRFEIRGPDIVTPAGIRTTGDYSRHHFAYVVPKGDPDAGKTIDMRLMNETTVF